MDFPGTRKLKLLLVCVATLKDDEAFVQIGVVSVAVQQAVAILPRKARVEEGPGSGRQWWHTEHYLK